VILLLAAIVLLASCADPEAMAAPRRRAVRSGSPPSAQFANPERVTIRGYDADAMEPFLTRDGRYLLFNDSNAPGRDTNLHYAERVDDLTFDYRGEIAGANTAALDAVASVDGEGNIYYISTRSYEQTLSTIYRGRFDDGRVTDVSLAGGVSRMIPGAVNFDVEVSADGETLYFADGVFTGGPVPQSADLVMARRNGDTFSRLDPGLLANINSGELEYAAAISADQLELFFTRFGSDEPRIYRSTRSATDQLWSRPERIDEIAGFVEAPTISPDGRALYYHARRGTRFVIERATRH
jgi:hypothetical protein